MTKQPKNLQGKATANQCTSCIFAKCMPNSVKPIHSFVALLEKHAYLKLYGNVNGECLWDQFIVFFCDNRNSCFIPDLSGI